MNDDSDDWSILLDAIAAYQIIPIVGRDLLRLTIDGREQFLYEYLAEQLAARWKVAWKPGASLDDVVVAYLNAGRRNQPTSVYPAAVEVLKKLRDADGRLPVPEPLRKLAAIEPLRLFISTTPDALLAGALGCPVDRVLAYAPNAKVTDIPLPLDDDPSPHRLVFQLFGALSALPDSALLEEDTLEFIWNLHEESSRRLLRLFDEIRKKRVLLIGNAHPNWLARFFVRLAREKRLSDGREAREFLADAVDEPQRGFFEYFSPDTRSFGAENAIEFVDLLAEKWAAYPNKPAPVKSGEPPAVTAFKPPAVFLSYASQDLEMADKLRTQLHRAGLDVWFDKKKLQSGEDWWKVIERNIVTCAVFLPVISKTSNERSEGVFLQEWNSAVDRLKRMDAAKARFIHPIIVDDTPSNGVAFSEFNTLRLHVTRATDGEVAGDFVASLIQVVKERRAST